MKPTIVYSLRLLSSNSLIQLEAIRRAEVRKELVNLIVATINRLNSKIATFYALGTNTMLVRVSAPPADLLLHFLL